MPTYESESVTKKRDERKSKKVFLEKKNRSENQTKIGNSVFLPTESKIRNFNSSR